MVLYLALWWQHGTAIHFFHGPRQPHYDVACHGGDERHDLLYTKGGKAQKAIFFSAPLFRFPS